MVQVVSYKSHVGSRRVVEGACWFATYRLNDVLVQVVSLKWQLGCSDAVKIAYCFGRMMVHDVPLKSPIAQ